MYPIVPIASAAVLALSCLAAPGIAAPAIWAAAAQAPAANGVAGQWTGPFLEGEWTFEFSQQDGVWTGRYMSSKSSQWHDLQAVEVSGNAVKFALPSQPVIRFDLHVDASGQVISGTFLFPGRPMLPFSATRRS